MRQKTFTYEPDYTTPAVKVGDEVVLVEYNNVLKDTTWWLPWVAPNGISGNMDPSVKRFHGWRGTTNDVAVYAHGLRKVLKVTSKVNERGDTVLKVTVGRDLHPEWN